MNKPVENFWQIKLANVKKALESNNFEVFIAETAEEAKKIVLENIIPKLSPKSISWGGSMTLVTTKLYWALKDNQNMKIIDTFEKKISDEEKLKRRRQSLQADLFLTGTNALTETGQLVNLDMIGNRIGGLTFGPEHVVVLIGRNKIVADLNEAISRIKNYAAPVNAMRLDMKTPCVKTSYCEECKSPERICNTWAITEKSFPKKRVKVILINEDSGL